jgi:hypothetical protein
LLQCSGTCTCDSCDSFVIKLHTLRTVFPVCPPFVVRSKFECIGGTADVTRTHSAHLTLISFLIALDNSWGQKHSELYWTRWQKTANILRGRNPFFWDITLRQWVIAHGRSVINPEPDSSGMPLRKLKNSQKSLPLPTHWRKVRRKDRNDGKTST